MSFIGFKAQDITCPHWLRLAPGHRARCSNRQEFFTNTSLVPVRTDPKPVNIRSGVYSPHSHHQTPNSRHRIQRTSQQVRNKSLLPGPYPAPSGSLYAPDSDVTLETVLSVIVLFRLAGSFIVSVSDPFKRPNCRKAPPGDPGAPWGLGVVAVITNLDRWHCNINTFDWPISTPYVHYYTGFINNKHEHSLIIHLGMYLVIFSE